MVAKALLPALSAFGIYAIWVYAHNLGTGDLALATIEAGNLPDSSLPLRKVYTGLPLTDRLLTTLTTFFWPIAAHVHPGLYLHSFAFSGTFGAAWVVITMEAYRKGNRGTLSSYTYTLAGLGGQLFSIAVAVPWWLALHLLDSGTADKPTADNMRISPGVIQTLPLVFLAGNMLPSALMAAPFSEIMTADLKQIFIAIWQPWPAYTAVLLFFANLFVTPFLGSDLSRDGKRSSIRAIRFAHAFAFAVAAATHQVTIVISGAAAIVPQIFTKTYAEALHPRVVFETPLPWVTPAAPVGNMADAVRAFLRWDYIVFCTAMLVWSTHLYRKAYRAVYNSENTFGLLFKTGMLSVLAGPVGAAVELMWERDELALHLGNESKPTKNGGKTRN